MDYIISKQVRVLVNVEGALREMAASLQYYPNRLQLVMVDRDVQIYLQDLKTLQLRDNEMHIRFMAQGQMQKFAFMFQSHDDAKELMSYMPLQQEAKASQEFMDKLDFEAKKTPVTSAIIALNILVFITLYSTEQLNPLTPKGTEVFHQWGANFITLTVEQPWRLFTCAWLHFGLLHIACNMYFLHALGRLSEKLIGPKFYLIIYIFSAFTGSLASLIWNEDPVTSLGASGAVFGVVGMIGAFLLTRKNEVPSMAFRNLKNNMIQIVVLNFLIGVSISAIDNAAHIGGLVGGFIGASIMSRSLNEEKRKKAFLPKLILGLIILPAIVIGIWKSGLIQSKPALVYQKVASTLDNKQEEKINEVQKLIKSYLRKELDKAVFVARISEIQSFWTQQFNDINSVSFSQDSRVYPSVLRINSVSEYRINKLQIALDFADQPELMQREIIKLKNNWKTEIY